MISDDEYLERVVRGINAVALPGADVRWNVLINGRQFDVVARFETGPYRVLVLIEVKGRKRRTSAEDVEAFITKATDQNANKIVFVTKAGFQKAAIEVAKKHGVDVFRVRFVPGDLSTLRTKSMILMSPRNGGGERPQLAIGKPIVAVMIDRCELTYSDGTQLALPTEPTQMYYYAHKSRFADGKSIADVVGPFITHPIDLNIQADRTINVAPPTSITPPDNYFLKQGLVSQIEVTFHADEALPITGNTRLEPTIISPIVEYENVVTGVKISLTASTLPVGEAQLEAGKFYFSYHPLQYYYVHAIDDGSMTLYLVESFQSGELLQAIFTQKTCYASNYVPVKDKEILRRLKSRLEAMKQ